MKKYPLIIICLLMAATSAFAARTDVAATTERLAASLAKASTPDDSIRILYDMFDAAPRARKHGIGDELYNLAIIHNRLDVAFDILRLCGGVTTDPQLIEHHIRQLAKLPASHDREESILFLKMKKLATESRTLPYDRQQKEIKKIEEKIRLKGASPRSLHEKMFDLYCVTEFLRNSSSSKVLTEYMDSLYSLAEDPALKLYAIRNIIYSEAANIYSDAGLHSRAIEADKKLLEIIAGLEKSYREKGRRYRDFSSNKYISYRRMLRNFKGLTPAEAQHYYSRILELAAESREVETDLDHNHSVKGYYLMAMGKYAEAIPELKARIAIETALPAKRLQLALLKQAAEATRDTASLTFALSGLNELLAEMNSAEADRRYKELQTAYDISSLKNKNANLQLEMADSKMKDMKQKMTLMIALWVIVAVLLVILFFYYSRYRHNASALRRLSDAVRHQRDRLKKSRFYDYYCDAAATPAPESEHPAHRTRERKDSNIVESTLSDMLYISAIGRDDREKYIFPVATDTLFTDIWQWLNDNAADLNTDCKISYPNKDFSFVTDRDCLFFVLTRIFRFAAKAAHGGSMTLESQLSTASKEVRFKFTHTGNRIPRGKEEVLFQDFISSYDLASDDEFALFYCRLNSFLLQSRLSYNPIDDGPAQLFFSIPYIAPEK